MFVFLLLGCQNNESKKMENSKMINENINVIIGDNSYNLNLIDNETSRAFMNMLPLNIMMKDLNQNEKYYYLSNSLPTNDYYPKRIQKGDVMIYNGNCLVIFYESFDTRYSYTIIGHIDNLNSLNNSDINVIFKK